MGNKRIVITGSTRGLGLCMARELLKGGCIVMISGRTWGAVDASLELLKRELPDAMVFGFPCDTGVYQQVETLWNESVKALGGVDHWINNAGIGQPTIPIRQLPPHDMESIVRTDLMGILMARRRHARHDGDGVGIGPDRRAGHYLVHGRSWLGWPDHERPERVRHGQARGALRGTRLGARSGTYLGSHRYAEPRDHGD